ncbi:MAG: helix-turn-helix domain-containing protein [Dysgonamonadaceae bacterium]|nr:helix-turn-helix domain-containing protein [Dysgonamonadaceae bacterium]
MRLSGTFTVIYCFFATLLATPTVAQTSADSLLAVLPHQSDTVKLESIRKLINLSAGQSVRKTYIDLLLDEAHRQGNSRYEGRALALLVEWYYPQFDSDSVFIAGKKAEDFTRRHQLYNFLFTIQQTLIQRYVDQHQLLTGLRKAEEAYAEAKSIGDDMAVARMLAAIASIYETMNQPAEAFKYYRESLDYVHRADNPTSFLIVENYINMAACSFGVERYETAIAYADSVINHSKGQIAEYLYLATYFKADANARLHRPAEALKYIREAETLYSPEFGEHFGVYLDEARQNYYWLIRDYTKALEYTGKTISFYLQNGLLDVGYRTALKNKAEILAEMGNGKEAASCFQKVLQLSDSLNTQQFYSQINELRTIYELDKSELKAEQHRMEKERNRNYFIFAAIACMLVIVGWIFHSRRMMRKNRGLYRQIKEQDRLAEEIEQLRQGYASAPAVETRLIASLQTQLQTAPADEQQTRLVARLREYLLADKHFTNPEMDMSKLISAIGANRTYLFEAMKTVTGQTPQDYINALRIEEGKRLLESTNELIDNIAERCGYKTSRTFYRLFRERYNISPTEYRKMAGEKS